jgi:N-acetylneuraminic acid mutarotase
MARTEVAAARIGHFIYVVGGFDSQGRSTDSLERYDVANDSWRLLRPLPVAVNHAAAAVYRRRLYVLGGYTDTGEGRGGTSGFYRYDPGRDRWSRLSSMPTRRAALAVGLIGSRLYAAGGANSSQGALRTLEAYDFRTRRWSSGPGMKVAREHLAGAVSGRWFYALAGRAAGRGNFRLVERYRPGARAWGRVPGMTKPRGGIAAAAVGRRIVVLGGEEDAGTIPQVELYDPRQRRWRRLPDMRTPRHGLGAASLGRRVFSLEGGPRPGLHVSNIVEALLVR